MKVVVTDYTFSSLEIEEAIIRTAGYELTGSQAKTNDSLIPFVSEADAVITQFAPVTKTVIDAMQRARVIVRYGIGVDNVDLESARRRGIPVCNVPDYCIDEVADHTLALILACTRRVVDNALKNREHKWGLATGLETMKALRDLTMGIVGFGRIGREVASRLRAFKCRLLIFDPCVSSSQIEAIGYESSNFNSLLERSDVVTLHCPSTADTRGIINTSTLSSMPLGSILINVARGDLVDSEALTQALRDGQLSAAGLDVFAPEPIPADHPVLKMPNVVISSHIASTSVPAVRKLRTMAANLALTALRGELPPNVVNGVTTPRTF
jgi:D-3-phosphoglycerate dehydrogenase